MSHAPNCKPPALAVAAHATSPARWLLRGHRLLHCPTGCCGRWSDLSWPRGHRKYDWEGRCDAVGTECSPGGHRRRRVESGTQPTEKVQVYLYTTSEGPIFERLVVRMQQPWTCYASTKPPWTFPRLDSVRAHLRPTVISDQARAPPQASRPAAAVLPEFRSCRPTPCC